MGKQINYWLKYEEFLQIAQAALDYGCVIAKPDLGKIKRKLQEAAYKSVKVRHPLYDQEYKFPVYTVVINRQEQEFAAGEFSNCVWGFYLLKN